MWYLHPRQTIDGNLSGEACQWTETVTLRTLFGFAIFGMEARRSGENPWMRIRDWDVHSDMVIMCVETAARLQQWREYWQGHGTVEVVEVERVGSQVIDQETMGDDLWYVNDDNYVRLIDSEMQVDFRCLIDFQVFKECSSYRCISESLRRSELTTSRNRANYLFTVCYEFEAITLNRSTKCKLESRNCLT